MSRLFRLHLFVEALTLFFLFGVINSNAHSESDVFGCGDFSGNGNITAGDLGFCFQYLFKVGPPPPDPSIADCDDYLYITVRDVQMLSRFLLADRPQPSCPITHSGPLPLDSTTVVTIAGFAPAFSSSMELIVSLTYTADSMSAFVLPLQLLMEGTPVTIDTVTFSDVTAPWQVECDATLRIDTANGVVLLAAYSLWDAITEYVAPGTHEIARIKVSYPSADSARDFTYQWKPLQPQQDLSGYPDTSLIPMVVGRYTDGAKDGFAVELPQSSPIVASTRMKPGDVNGNGLITIADLVYLVSYLFNSGPTPNPLAAGNVNCIGSITVADLVYLVSYLFNDGPAPCAG